MQPSAALGARGHCGAQVHRVNDLSGSRFGRLAVLALAGRARNRDAVWRCACDCGAQADVAASGLQGGKTTSCGCAKAQNRPADLSGRRFGRLVAIRLAPGAGRARWVCICDCGRQKVAGAGTLARGHVVSCGCAKVDQPGLMADQVREDLAARGHVRRARKRAASGRFTAAQVRALYARQRGRCAWCAASLADGFHRDHRVPLALGGANDITNIDLLCPGCNVRKGAKDPIAWAVENGRLL